MNQPRHLMTRAERAQFTLSSWRFSVPALLAAGSTVGMLMPVFLPGPCLPHFPLLFVYYWITHRPNMMPVWACFLIGLVVDVTMAVPLGLNATLLALLGAGLATQYTAFASRPFQFGFAIALPVLILYEAASWFVLILEQPLLRFTPFFFQALISWMALPLITWLNAVVQTHVIDNR